jgi:hypothetical protein
MGYQIGWIDWLGIIAVLFNIYASIAKTMIPLRAAAVAACAAFVVYGALKGAWLVLVPNMVLLPINLWRLVQMRKLISDVKAAAEGDARIEPLLPFMRPRKLKAGARLFAKGDVAEEAFYITSGVIRLEELGRTLTSGAVLGEIGLFTAGNQRLATAVCETDVELMYIGYERFETLCYQNPHFGFYMMRLIVQRLQANLEHGASRP